MRYPSTILLLSAAVLAGVVGCNKGPGGLTREEYDALPPAERAHLRIEQDQLNEQRIENSRRQLDRLEADDKSKHGKKGYYDN